MGHLENAFDETFDEGEEIREELSKLHYAFAYSALQSGFDRDELLKSLDRAANCAEIAKENGKRMHGVNDFTKARWATGRASDELLMAICSKACAVHFWEDDERLQNEFSSPSHMWRCILAMRQVRDTFIP
jgi:hypothetical protein